MITATILALALTAQPPPYSEKGFGGLPRRPTPAEKRLLNSGIR
jgi:hypothetical protein